MFFVFFFFFTILIHNFAKGGLIELQDGFKYQQRRVEGKD